MMKNFEVTPQQIKEELEAKLKLEIESLKEQRKEHLKKHGYYRHKNLLEKSIVFEKLAAHHLNTYVELDSLISLNEILIGI